MDTVRRPSGFSLVELLISVVIGMLALLFATRLVVNGESNKNAAIGGSDSMQNGMLALFSLSNDAAAAGWGLNDTLVAGCNTVFADSQGYQLLSALRDGVAIRPLAAVVIQSNGANPDVVSFNSGSSQMGVGSLKMTATYSANSNIMTTESNLPYGFNNKDVLVVATNTNDGTPCTLMQMSGFNQQTGHLNEMYINAGNDYRYNPQAGVAQGYKANATYVYNLGQPDLLHFHTWSVNNGVLMLRATDLAGAANSAVSVADNVVSIKAQYGFDTRVISSYNPSPPGNSNQTASYKNGVLVPAAATGMQITQWSSSMINADSSSSTGDAGDYQRIVAVRLAVVARSKTAEKPNLAGQCSATTVKPQVFAQATPAGVTAVPIDVNVTVAGDSTDWKCYRYRVFETIVPVINSQFRP